MSKLILSPDHHLWPHWQQMYPSAEIRQELPLYPDKAQVIWLDLRLTDWQDQLALMTKEQYLVLALSLSPNLEQLRLCLQLGARGYLHALSDYDTLIAADYSVQHRGIWLGEDLVQSFISLSHSAQERSGDLSGLSTREQGVALLVAKGLSNKQIAQQLDISENTVKVHLGQIFQKLQVKDRLKLALFVGKTGD